MRAEHLVGGERDPVAPVQRIADRGRAREVDHRPVDGKAGVGVQDLGAGAAEDQHGERHRHLAAGHDDDLAGVDLHAEAPRGVGGDRLAQRGDAVGGRVAVMAVAEGPARGLDDVRRGREVGLADTEVDHRAAAGREGLRPREDLERALGAERGDVGGDVHGGAPRDSRVRAVPCAGKPPGFPGSTPVAHVEHGPAHVRSGGRRVSLPRIRRLDGRTSAHRLLWERSPPDQEGTMSIQIPSLPRLTALAVPLWGALSLSLGRVVQRDRARVGARGREQQPAGARDPHVARRVGVQDPEQRLVQHGLQQARSSAAT